MNKVYIIAIVLVITLGVVHFGSAFTGPTNSGGVGDGAIAVDGFSNIGVGASSTYSGTKFYVRASSTATTSYAVRVLQPAGTPLFTVRDDGAVAIATTTPSGAVTTKLNVGGDTSITGTLTATTLVGTLSGSLSAANVTANVFGAGNFSFPASLGIATTTQVSLPATLSVYGTGYFSGNVSIGGGTGKLDVGTVDPPYTINGKPYATYMSSMTGVKEETTGVAQCVIARGRCSVVIDFNDADEGSDLWLFSKTADLKHTFDRMTVLVTPSFAGTVWYEKDANAMTLTMHGIASDGIAHGEISYRLTAPRFDSALWPNIPHKPTSAGFIIND